MYGPSSCRQWARESRLYSPAARLVATSRSRSGQGSAPPCRVWSSSQTYRARASKSGRRPQYPLTAHYPGYNVKYFVIVVCASRAVSTIWPPCRACCLAHVLGVILVFPPPHSSSRPICRACRPESRAIRRAASVKLYSSLCDIAKPGDDMLGRNPPEFKSLATSYGCQGFCCSVVA